MSTVCAFCPFLCDGAHTFTYDNGHTVAVCAKCVAFTIRMRPETAAQFSEARTEHTMKLVADVFVDGHYNHTIHHVKGIREQLQIEHAWGLRIREKKRTRYHGDSRFHVYLYDRLDARNTQTLIFRYEAA